MLKRLAVVLTLVYSLILTGYAPATLAVSSNTAHADEAVASYTGLDDPSLLSDFEDTVLAFLGSELGEGYYLSDIQARYVSQEYLDEVAYNSQETIYFGYTLPELDEYFEDTRYVFTLGDDGTTVVQAFEGYNDVFGQVVRDVAIGTGVILFTVTISAIAPVAGAPAAVTVLLVASAETAVDLAISSAVIGAVVGGAAAAIEGGDTEGVLKSAALEGANAFKFGAIVGAVGGAPLKLATTIVLSSSVKAGTVTAEGIQYIEKTVATVDGKLVKGVFPVFEAPYTVKLPKQLVQTANRAKHAKYCNQTLLAAAKADPSLATSLGLTADDIVRMGNGYNPSGYVWHHNEELGVIQLVDEAIHSATSHTGGFHVWYL